MVKQLNARINPIRLPRAASPRSRIKDPKNIGRGRPKGSPVRDLLMAGNAAFVKQSKDWEPWDWAVQGPPHTAGVWTVPALTMVKEMAANGQGQNIIAAKMGVILKTWNHHIAENKQDNPLALAWQAGWAEHEQFWRDMCMEMAMGDSKGATIMAIFYAKSQFGWRDRNDITINNNGGGNIVYLPKGLSGEEYYKKLGISGPVRLDAPMMQIEAPKDITPVLAGA